MSLQLLASDLDGTLLQNGAQQLTPEALELIPKLKDKGILFTAASGRQYDSLRRLFAPVADDIAYICENGSLVMYQGKILYHAEIERILGQEIFNCIEQYPNCELMFSTPKMAYIAAGNKKFLSHMRDEVGFTIEALDDIYTINEPYIKISVYRESGLTAEDTEFFKKRFGHLAHVVTSGTEWLDIMPMGINKGVGITKLANALHLPLKNCMAVGDHYNDFELLQTVGNPVAVANAQPGILEICERKTKTVEALLKEVLKIA